MSSSTENMEEHVALSFTCLDEKPTMVLSEVMKHSARTTTCDSVSDDAAEIVSDDPKSSEHEKVNAASVSEVFTSTAVSDPGLQTAVPDADEDAPLLGVGATDMIHGVSSEPSQVPHYDSLNEGFGYSMVTGDDDAHPVGYKVIRQRSLPRREPRPAQSGRVSRYSTMPIHLTTTPASPVPPPGPGSHLVPGPRGAADILLEGEEELHRPMVQCADGGANEMAVGVAALPWWRRWFCGTPVPHPPVVFLLNTQSDQGCQAEGDDR